MQRCHNVTITAGALMNTFAFVSHISIHAVAFLNLIKLNMKVHG